MTAAAVRRCPRPKSAASAKPPRSRVQRIAAALDARARHVFTRLAPGVLETQDWSAASALAVIVPTWVTASAVAMLLNHLFGMR